MCNTYIYVGGTEVCAVRVCIVGVGGEIGCGEPSVCFLVEA